MLGLVVAGVAAACGGAEGPEGRVGDTVAVGWRVIADAERTLETQGSEADPERVSDAHAAVQGARERLSRVEGVVRIWQDTGVGELGWYTLAPCLATALDRVEERLRAASLPVPVDLDQARAMAMEASDADCRERRTADAERAARAP